MRSKKKTPARRRPSRSNRRPSRSNRRPSRSSRRPSRSSRRPSRSSRRPSRSRGRLQHRRRSLRGGVDDVLLDVDKCPICTELLTTAQNDQGLLTTTVCRHTFHEACLADWRATLNRLERPNTCPVCRRLIDDPAAPNRDPNRRIPPTPPPPPPPDDDHVYELVWEPTEPIWDHENYDPRADERWRLRPRYVNDYDEEVVPRARETRPRGVSSDGEDDNNARRVRQRRT